MCRRIYPYLLILLNFMKNMGKGRCFKNLILVNVVILCCYIYYSLNDRSWSWYLHTAPAKVICQTPKREYEDLLSLARDTHYCLEEFRLTHILIYGSLFGAIRYRNPLPWDNDVDILLRKEELDNIDEELFMKSFRKRNISIRYRHWFGAYRITRGTARGDLMIFKNFTGTMNRIGIESYVFFINYWNFHAFPATLIEAPLPKLMFAGVNISVPRHGLQLQKFHYRQDWWLEKLPHGCKPTKAFAR